MNSANTLTNTCLEERSACVILKKSVSKDKLLRDIVNYVIVQFV